MFNREKFPICDGYPNSASMPFSFDSLGPQGWFYKHTNNIMNFYLKSSMTCMNIWLDIAQNHIRSRSNIYLFNESNVCSHTIFKLSPTSGENKIVTRFPDPVLVLLVFYKLWVRNIVIPNLRLASEMVHVTDCSTKVNIKHELATLQILALEISDMW